MGAGLSKEDENDNRKYYVLWWDSRCDSRSIVGFNLHEDFSQTAETAAGRVKQRMR